MNKDELIAFLCEYLQKIKLAKEKSLNGVLGNNYHLEEALKKVSDNPLEIIHFDLELLRGQLGITDEVIEKYAAYKFFANSQAFKLTDEQILSIKTDFSNYLDKILEKNDQKISMYPEISNLDDDEYRVSQVLNRILNSNHDITLDEYLEIVKILRTVNTLYAKDLLRRLSTYMNAVVLNAKRRQYENDYRSMGR